MTTTVSTRLQAVRLSRKQLVPIIKCASPTQFTKQFRACVDCKHFDASNNTCKVILSVRKPIKTLYCRTSDDLCGTQAKYFSRKDSESGNENALNEYLWEGTDEYEVYAQYARSQGWEPNIDQQPTDTEVSDLKSILRYWLQQ